MQATENQETMEAELCNMRDKARRLLGDKCEPHMVAHGTILTRTAGRDKTRPPAVETELARRRERIGMDLMPVVAVAVELAERTQ